MKINKIALALSFSPRIQAMMAEATRWAKMHQAKLFLVHVGEKSKEAEEKVSELLESVQWSANNTTVLWRKGDPTDNILQVCKQEQIDLLIAGALKKENLVQYYLGTPARKILRKASCSVLMLVNPAVEPQPVHNVVVNAEDSPYVAEAIRAAFEIGIREKSSWLHVVREVKMLGLTLASLDDCTEEEYDQQRNSLMQAEIENVEKMLAGIAHEGLRTNIKLVSGKSGFELSQFAQKKKAELLVVGASPRRLFFFDRVFPHDLEYIFQDLPCNLLVVHSRARKEATHG
jgi:nucleotide-binding universal stress UspA family protein